MGKYGIGGINTCGGGKAFNKSNIVDHELKIVIETN